MVGHIAITPLVAEDPKQPCKGDHRETVCRGDHKETVCTRDHKETMRTAAHKETTEDHGPLIQDPGSRPPAGNNK